MEANGPKSRQVIIAALAVVIGLVASGCSSLVVKRTPVEIAPTRTNIVQLVTTNIVQREAWTTNTVQVAPQRTNEIGVVLPPIYQLQPVKDLITTQILQTNLQAVVLPSVWFTNLSLADGAGTAIKTIGELAPVPYGGLAGEAVAGLAGLVFGAVNWFGRRKALKAAGVAQSSADQFRDATQATVMGFEQLRKVALKVPGYTSEIDKNVMQVVQGIQVAAGVKDVVHAIVEEHTESTK